MRLVTSRFTAVLLSAALIAPLARADDDSYIRITDDAKAEVAKLDVAVREFQKGDGPKVILVGAVHIGDQSYYDELQKFLDAQDLVLFEGVKPGAIVPLGASADDASRIKLTKQRVRMVGVVVEQYRAKHKRVPTDLKEAIGEEKGPAAKMIEAATVDGWGHPITLVAAEVADRKFDVVSFGSDGKDGGDGAAGDIKLSGMKPISKDEASVEDGIQVKLARALKLEFQLAAMDYTKANWRNSDMTMEELSKRLGGSGEASEDGEGKQNALMGMLSGQSLGAKVVGFMLGIIERSPMMSSMTKLMMLEMLGHADELMEAQGSALMGVDGAQLMKVLIDDRNEVVLEDLKKVIAESPEVKTIAVFYGAGHLAKMQKSLVEDGYVAGETTWYTAIKMDLKDLPGGAASAKMTREMIRKQLEAQIKKGK